MISHLVARFEQLSDAERALKLNNSLLDGDMIQVQLITFAESVEPVYLKFSNIEHNIERTDFRSIVDAFGDIEMLKHWPDNPSDPQTNGHCYVKYVDPQTAQLALMLNGSKLNSLPIEVAIVQQPPPEERMFMNTLDPNEIKQGLQQVLVQVKGGKGNGIRSSMVEFSAASLNSGDVFVLDAGKIVYQWNGKGATKFEKARGLDIASNIRVKERQGNAKLHVLDEQDEQKNMQEQDLKKIWEQFWTSLCGSASKIAAGKQLVKNEKEGGEDIPFHKMIDERIRLYRIAMTPIRPKKGVVINKPYTNVTLKLVWSHSQPSKALLKSEYVYVVDYFNEIFIWEGKDSKPDQRAFAKRFSMKLQEQDKRPLYCTVTKVLESAETVLFKEKFCDFGGMLPIAVSATDFGAQKAQVQQKKQLSPEEVLKQMTTEKPPQEDMFDDGNGKKTIWRVDGFEKVLVEESLHGNFFSGDSFVILYQYKKKNKDCKIVYFWQGRDSSTNEKGASALLTIDVSKEAGGDALQVYVM